MTSKIRRCAIKPAASKSALFMIAMGLCTTILPSARPADAQTQERLIDRLRLAGHLETGVVAGEFLAIDPAVSERPTIAHPFDTGPNASYADDIVKAVSGNLYALGRIQGQVEDIIEIADYGYKVGAKAHLEYNFDTENIEELEGYLFADVGYGRLFLGTDVNATYDLFDPEFFYYLGPQSPLFSLRGAVGDQGFTQTDMDRIRLVGRSRTISGAGLSAALDGRGNWQLGTRYFGSIGAADLNFALAGDNSGALGLRLKANLNDFGFGFITGVDNQTDYFVGVGGNYTQKNLELAAAATIVEARRSNQTARDFNVVLSGEYQLSDALTFGGSLAWFNLSRSGTGFDNDNGAEMAARITYKF